MTLRALPVIVVLVGLGLPGGDAHGQASPDEDRPAASHLVLAGLGMAIPAYFLGVTIHEGSHAVAAKLVGADVVGLQLLPGRHPVNKRFYFGYTEIDGRLSAGEMIFFLVAPKIVDVVMLSGYTALVGLDGLPDNRYGQLALAVWATGFWLDFAKDVLPIAEHHDTPRIYTLLGWQRETSRLPLRIIHGTLAVASALVIYEGYARVFGHRDPDVPGSTLAGNATTVIVPLLRGRFARF